MNTVQFRRDHNVSRTDMIAALKAEYPKYSAATQSMVDNPDDYGVGLLDAAEQLILEQFAIPDELPALPPLTQRIIDAIPYGKDAAISRDRLTAAVGMSDRQCRYHISFARGLGYVICNEGRGYYRSEDAADKLMLYRVERARAMAILVAIAPVGRQLRRDGLL